MPRPARPPLQLCNSDPLSLYQAARVLVATRFGRARYPLPGASETHARFKVKCADEAGARCFLVPLPLEELERFPDLVVEGCGGHLVFFRPRKTLEPAAFPRFQDEVRTLARLFPGEMQIS